MKTANGQALYAKARRLIPGGTQLLSKRPEMFLPGQWPNYYVDAKGAEVTDLDGNIFLDMCYCGIGATVLGYSDPDVNGAVKYAVDHGSMTTLNCPEEVELAEILVDLHPWANMVRFSRAGGEAMAIAVRIARAATGRDKVAFCGYHGWHDWYLSANLSDNAALDGHLLPGLDPAGVPRGLRGLMLPFHYNALRELEEIVAHNKGEIAAIVMEPVRDHSPMPEFLGGVRNIASQIGAALILDEVTAGFRVNTGGIHLTLAVEPDLAVFAKALGNGFPISAVVGRSQFMQAAQGTFVSSTAWTERVGSSAALATIKKYRENNVSAHLIRIGEKVKAVWKQAAAKNRLRVHISGLAPLAHFAFEHPNAQAMRTLYTQLMLDRGILATGAFYAMFAHDDAHIARFTGAVDESFAILAEAVDRNDIDTRLKGPVAHSGFKRLT